ncbi:MAG: FAD binding domain-containing protein [Syntrophaceae bacterium]|nr:FAD binding domain-containing protein [Syntrophaceae bacterium]
MILPELNIITPGTLAEALRLLREYPNSKPLAGGTDLLVLLKQRTVDCRYLIDLSGLPELKTVEVKKESVHIGAGITLSEIGENDLIRRNFSALAEAARCVATPNLRNMATLGGNLCLTPRCLYYNQSAFWRESVGWCFKTGGATCFAVPGSRRCYACFSADCPPALMALEADVTIARWGGEGIAERRIPLGSLYREDGLNPLNLADDEVVTAVQLPLREGIRSTYRKYRLRASIDFPLAGVAVAFGIAGGGFLNIRIALNALASSPILAKEAMDLLEGRPYSEEIIEEAVSCLTRRTRPVRNQEGSPEHRRRMARILFQRGVEKLITVK